MRRTCSISGQLGQRCARDTETWSQPKLDDATMTSGWPSIFDGTRNAPQPPSPSGAPGIFTLYASSIRRLRTVLPFPLYDDVFDPIDHSAIADDLVFRLISAPIA